MIHIQEIKLDNVILPSEGIGIVMMQPYADIDSNSEPFKWASSKKQEQIERIERTLFISLQKDHGANQTHFTIFPEYSIPGIDGIKAIEDTLIKDEWPKGTLVIGGIDGLTSSEYKTVCESSIVHESNHPDKINESWVNCCITWVKDNDGNISKYIQPKLIPNIVEKESTCMSMFKGNSVFFYSAKFDTEVSCNFFNLICFDWIGELDRNNGIYSIIDNLNQIKELDLHFIFVLKLNPKPNQEDFLKITANFYSDKTKAPKINRDYCTTIFSNTAGNANPGNCESLGFSSLICSSQAQFYDKGCLPGYAMKTDVLRNSKNLGRCKDALFRESGACIHSFIMKHPRWLNTGSSSTQSVISKAITHSIDGILLDPRVSGGQVPASTKWVNDRLDKLSSLSIARLPQDISNNINTEHKEICKKLRIKKEDKLREFIELSITSYEKWITIAGLRKTHAVDDWNIEEAKGLKNTIHISSILKTSYELNSQDCIFHAEIIYNNEIYDLIVVQGKEHEECIEYASKKWVGKGLSEQRKLLIVSQDENNTMWHDRLNSSITNPMNESITNPSKNKQIGYQNILDCCIQSTTIEEMKQRLNQLLV